MWQRLPAFGRGEQDSAALLILPITVNVVAFHLFLDGGLLTGGAVLGNIMLLVNAYFLWQHRHEYRPLLAQTS